jgi:hypothetical protein
MTWRAKLGFVAALLPPLTLPAGCEGFGRGVTQAVLEGAQGDGEDTRNCEVEGRPFTGVEPYLAKQDKLPPFGDAGVGERPEVKVLYVHGIGTHAPGHGAALRQNLAKSLGSTSAPRGRNGSLSRARSSRTGTWGRSTSRG